MLKRKKSALLAVLALIVLIFVAACSSKYIKLILNPIQVEKPEDPIDEGNNEPHDDQAYSDMDVANEDKAVKKTPEEILDGYYYGKVDQELIDFEVIGLDGNTVKLSDYKGKIIFLNFWATWCPPCRDEMPHMQAFYDKYKDDDVIVLAVNPSSVENQGLGSADKAEQKVRDFLTEYKYTFPVLLDKDDSAWAIYMQRGIPANYVIDSEGIIRYLKPGAFASLEEMEAFLEAARAVSIK